MALRKTIPRPRPYKPFDRQEQFHFSPAKYRLFGGAAGPGKTKALLWEAIRQADQNPGCDTLLLRRTYPELESSLLAYFRRDVARRSYRSYNEAKHVVTWHNGATTRFGYCRNENDVYQYQGAEFLFIGLDELTHFTLKQWQFLTSRNRCPVKGSFPCMAGASNPGNIGHAWVKALWVDKTPPPGFERPEAYDARDYDFIRARLDDNPIYANDAEYRRTLEALPEHLRRAFLEGDWNVFAGQYFDVFEIGRHTARPEDVRLEPWLPRWISIDWGFQHPSAVYWHCAVPNVAPPFRAASAGSTAPVLATSAPGCHPERSEGSQRVEQMRSFGPASAGPHADNSHAAGTRIVTYREFVQNSLSPRMLAQAIVERCGRENIREVFLSPDAFAHRTAEASIAEQLGDVVVANGLPRPTPADDDRIGGWQWMYQLLENDSWLITDNCAKLIECLPQLVRDDRRIEDIRKVDGDDPADAARYGLVAAARFAASGPHVAPGFSLASVTGENATLKGGATPPRFVTGMPLGEQIARQVSAEDPTSRAIHYQRLEAEAQEQFRPKPLFRRRW
jgi:phage terminase large subunit